MLKPVAVVRAAHGDPESFAERELKIDDSALQTLPIGTKLVAMPVPYACACIGPVWDCPCVRRRESRTAEIVESQVSHQVWMMLTDEEKNTINNLKIEAFARYVRAKP